MAATAEAARLTEAHRLAQTRIGVQVIGRMHSAWPLLDPEQLDRSFAGWLRVVTPIVQSQRVVSARLAANYLITFRTLELGVQAAFTPTLAEAADLKALTTSMLVTGPASIRAAVARGVPLANAVDTAETRSAAAAMRHALNGGRQTILDTLSRDRRAIGWARATSGSPCAFCAMLASRGPVYGEEVDFQAHDHCTCGAEPVYRDDAAWPQGAQRYRDLWDEATDGVSDDDALNAFRRALSR